MARRNLFLFLWTNQPFHLVLLWCKMGLLGPKLIYYVMLVGNVGSAYGDFLCDCNPWTYWITVAGVTCTLCNFLLSLIHLNILSCPPCWYSFCLSWTHLFPHVYWKVATAKYSPCLWKSFGIDTCYPKLVQKVGSHDVLNVLLVSSVEQ
jgi:hypothetical protein